MKRVPLIGRNAGACVCFALVVVMINAVARAADFDTECAPARTGAVQSRAADPSNLTLVLKQASAGDTIVLGDGYYGQVALSGANSDFVTITGRPGGRAVLASLTVAGSHWVVRGLTIDGASSPGVAAPPTPPGKWPLHSWLVRIQGGDNIVMDGNVVTSRPGSYPWKEEALGVDDPTPLWSGVLATNAACVTLSNNQISNVFAGIGIEGDQIGNRGKYYQILHNKIDNFAADGIDHSVSEALIYANIITNSHDICNNICVHTDGMQGYNYHDQSGVINYNVKIDGNIIIQKTSRDILLPGDDLHGLTIFDGFWKNVTLTNNAIVTGTWNGIAISGVDGLVIENNTVLANGPRRTWISAGGTTHQGGESKNVIVRNNIASAITMPKVIVEHMKVDHNLILDDARSVFVKFDVADARYDLHPRAGTAAAGRGSPDGAPALDIEGKPRAIPIDLGAYQRAQ